MLETPTSPAVATPAAPVPELPTIRPGSHVDAKVLRRKIQHLLAAVDRADEHVRLLCQMARDRKIFLVLEGPSGAYFKDWTAFCIAPVPWGLGMDRDLIQELVKEQRDPKRQARLVLEGPLLLQTRAAPRKGRAPASVTRGMAYSLQRLKRDRPDLLEKVASGELPSLQAAAELAGHRPPLAGVLVEPQSIARLIVSRLEPPQQEEVIRLVQHPQEIPDPGHGKNPFWDAYKERTVPPDVLAQQRAQAKAEKAAQRQRYEAAYREKRNAERAAQRAQAAALGLPSLAVDVDVEAAG